MVYEDEDENEDDGYDPISSTFYKLIIGNADGSFVNYEGTRPKETLEFLKKHDHEGADIYLELECRDNEGVYKILEGAMKND